MAPSYAAVASLLSSAALVGVVISIRLQIEQNKRQRRQSVREMQFDLLRLTMSDPLYASSIKSAGAASDEFDQVRLSLLRNQWFRYFEFAYLSNEITPEDVKLALID